MNKILFFVLFLIAFMVLPDTSMAQLAPKTGSSLTTPNANYKETQMKIYSMFIYNFIKYIEWPEQSSEFTIGVYASDELVVKLEEIARLMARNNVSLRIRNFHDYDRIIPCNIIFIPEEKSNEITKIVSKFQTRPVLVVTSDQNGIAKGGGANIITIEGRPRFQLNDNGLNTRGLKVAGQLKSLAYH